MQKLYIVNYSNKVDTDKATGSNCLICLANI